jgi:hypothetical protein
MLLLSGDILIEVRMKLSDSKSENLWVFVASVFYCLVLSDSKLMNATKTVKELCIGFGRIITN